MLEVADITLSSSFNVSSNISRAIVGFERDMVGHMQWVEDVWFVRWGVFLRSVKIGVTS